MIRQFQVQGLEPERGTKAQRCLGCWARGRARLPHRPLKRELLSFCLSGERLQAAAWLFLCDTMSLSLFFLPQSFSSLTMMIEFPGQNNPFFFDWENWSKCHNVLVSSKLNITGPQKVPRGETIRPQSAQSLLCVCDSEDKQRACQCCWLGLGIFAAAASW